VVVTVDAGEQSVADDAAGVVDDQLLPDSQNLYRVVG